MLGKIKTSISRRYFLGTAAASSLTFHSGRLASAQVSDDSFVYEVNRTEEEWRAILSDHEYAILREGETEAQKTSPLWNETRKGHYACKGCDLTIYQGNWKTVIEKGWAFFRHSEPDTVLTGIDGEIDEYGDMANSNGATIEVHCRRCGSHMGHILFVLVALEQLHCINGTSLTFYPETT